jgi:hypothetical protein
MLLKHHAASKVKSDVSSESESKNREDKQHQGRGRKIISLTLTMDDAPCAPGLSEHQ